MNDQQRMNVNIQNKEAAGKLFRQLFCSKGKFEQEVKKYFSILRVWNF